MSLFLLFLRRTLILLFFFAFRIASAALLGRVHWLPRRRARRSVEHPAVLGVGARA